jgi:hypothetical protein
MFRFARSSPKLRRLSSAPSALMLTLMPETDFCCARALKVASPLGSGLKLNESTKPINRARIDSKIAAATILEMIAMIL